MVDKARVSRLSGKKVTLYSSQSRTDSKNSRLQGMDIQKASHTMFEVNAEGFNRAMLIFSRTRGVQNIHLPILKVKRIYFV
jgi:hypothetical protein